MSGVARALCVIETVGLVCLAMPACRSSQPPEPPTISFTRLPASDHGSPDIIVPIEGRVSVASAEQKIVLFARAGEWWVQPAVDQPFTPIAKDSTWKARIHPGNAYAALLVDPGYVPPPTANALPQPGGAVRAVAVVEGAALTRVQSRQLQFSGYDWSIRHTPTGMGPNYDAAHASVDRDGALHLRLAKNGEVWTGAQLELTRSLGYGSYRVVVRDVSRFDPAVVFAFSTFDETGPFREMDIEISRWGESVGKNAQYTIQPYYIPANVVRFFAPPGRLTYSFTWQPGRVTFTTVEGDGAGEADVW